MNPRWIVLINTLGRQDIDESTLFLLDRPRKIVDSLDTPTHCTMAVPTLSTPVGEGVRQDTTAFTPSTGRKLFAHEISVLIQMDGVHR